MDSFLIYMIRPDVVFRAVGCWDENVGYILCMFTNNEQYGRYKIVIKRQKRMSVDANGINILDKINEIVETHIDEIARHFVNKDWKAIKKLFKDL